MARSSEKETELIIREGLAELEGWLTNLIHMGLWDFQIKEQFFWNEIAYRMQLAKMDNLSQWLQNLFNIQAITDEALVGELGRIMLLIRNFDQFDQLTDGTKVDICSAIGWFTPIQKMNHKNNHLEPWVVIGQRHRKVKPYLTEQINWLYGLDSNRTTSLRLSGEGEITSAPNLFVGQVIDASLTYLPSNAPVEVIISKYKGELPSSQINGHTINEAMDNYTTALKGNPWLRPYPFFLRDIYITRFDRGWIVRHQNGAFLPIAPYYQPKWGLYALSGGHPIQLGATWNGYALYPFSVNVDGNFYNLHPTIDKKVWRYDE